MNAEECGTVLFHTAVLERAMVQRRLGHQDSRDPVKQEAAVPGDFSDFICHEV